VFIARKPTVMQNLRVGHYSFEQIKDFKYLEVNINQRNNIHNEIRLKLFSINIGYHTMSRTKTKLNIAYLSLIIMYVSETRATSKGDELKFLIFERNSIYGPILNLESENYERKK